MAVNQTGAFPDDRGRYGDYGGKFVPETLMAALEELEEAYQTLRGHAAFQEELGGCCTTTPDGPLPFTMLPTSPASAAARRYT